MPLSKEQRDALTAEAQKRNIDPDRLIAAAEEHVARPPSSGEEKAAASGTKADQPKLFQYHLPFVTVGEVRRVWLGLTDSFPGDGEVASDWAAKHGGGGGDAGGQNTPPG